MYGVVVPKRSGNERQDRRDRGHEQRGIVEKVRVQVAVVHAAGDRHDRSFIRAGVEMRESEVDAPQACDRGNNQNCGDRPVTAHGC